MLHFVMPEDALAPLQVDEVFRSQAEWLRIRGYEVTTVSEDAFRENAVPRGIPPGTTVLYRGWMLKLEEYHQLHVGIRSCGAQLFTDPGAYALTHHLPNWYPLLAEFTAETVVVSGAEELYRAMHELGWGAYFLKDYVKSLKVAGGSIVRSESDARIWVEKMIEYRDEIEGGICIRRVEAFVPQTENRYFVLDAVPSAPHGREIPGIVRAAAERISSRFFTVDTAMTEGGIVRIVELGDGQVSDLVGWNADRFANLWPDLRPETDR